MVSFLFTLALTLVVVEVVVGVVLLQEEYFNCTVPNAFGNDTTTVLCQYWEINRDCDHCVGDFIVEAANRSYCICVYPFTTDHASTFNCPEWCNESLPHCLVYCGHNIEESGDDTEEDTGQDTAHPGDGDTGSDTGPGEGLVKDTLARDVIYIATICFLVVLAICVVCVVVLIVSYNVYLVALIKKKRDRVLNRRSAVKKPHPTGGDTREMQDLVVKKRKVDVNDAIINDILAGDGVDEKDFTIEYSQVKDQN
jgi:hypothetical protein